MGMSTCISGGAGTPKHTPPIGQNGQALGGMGQCSQMWVLDSVGIFQTGAITLANTSGVSQCQSGHICLEAKADQGIVVAGHCTSGVSSQAWYQGISDGLIRNGNASSESCLTSMGKARPPSIDPWCAQNQNMWRVSTDILDTWLRILLNLEGMIGMGAQAGPGHWNDPDFLEVLTLTLTSTLTTTLIVTLRNC